MTASLAQDRRVLADVLPGERTTDLALVVGSAALVGVSAQIVIPLPFTPVPLSLATLSVLLVGASLGPVRGGLSLLLYLAAGMAGVPWFSQQGSGWDFPSFGYIVGFVVAAALVGWMARRRGDRTVSKAAGAMIVGNAVIYLAGVPWLMNSVQVDLVEALRLGVVPFLVGDALKIGFAAVLLPLTWKFVGSTDDTTR